MNSCFVSRVYSSESDVCHPAEKPGAAPAPAEAPAATPKSVRLFIVMLHLLFTESTATFMAKVGGDPIPNVKWMKGKWRQITHGGRISVDQKGQEAKLEIREVTRSDSGQYRCVASNKHGEVECSSELHVEEKKETAVLDGDLRAKLKNQNVRTIITPIKSTNLTGFSSQDPLEAEKSKGREGHRYH
uniref:Ig-like domain-containing protein n=1 Tax=Takifugu rubripes TaxID=31033 RepID=A0A674N001_TAKRU